MAAVCLAVVAALPAFAGNFTMISQNLLHYGWNQGAVNRNLTFRVEFQNAEVVVVQELMNPAALNQLNPGGYTALASGLLGRTTYFEAYGFLIAGALNPQALQQYPDPNDDFERPPAFVQIRPGGGRARTWIGNIHLIFGSRGVTARYQEVAAIQAAALSITGPGARLVIGGDWNLGATSPGFNPLYTAGFDVEPNDRTSVNTRGRLVSRYDHFVWSANVTLNNADSIVPLNLLTWRNNVSDHIGISCDVDD
ncbi:MAG TPA: endonuclease/exonuclease/phosphatase family protein [Thermoanaerobaculia bacterium]|nr:endonuclease/exonuclease/phosphatase family protein [Thermoanaerobaculia bacterium]